MPEGPNIQIAKGRQAAQNLGFKGSAELVFGTYDMKQENAIAEAAFEFLYFEAVDVNDAPDEQRSFPHPTS